MDKSRGVRFRSSGPKATENPATAELNEEDDEDDIPHSELDITKPPRGASIWNTWRSNTNEALWTPPMREYSASAICSGKLLLFGGIGASIGRYGVLVRSTPFKELFETLKLCYLLTVPQMQAELDLKTKRWNRVEATGVPPSARSKCTMSTTGDRVVVFGGEGAFDGHDCPGNVRSSRSVFNDLFSYSALEYHWEGLPIVGSPPTKQVPGPRRGHTATTHRTPNGDALLVFGGCGPEPIRGHDKFMNDLWFLDLHTHIWTKLE